MAIFENYSAQVTSKEKTTSKHQLRIIVEIPFTASVNMDEEQASGDDQNKLNEKLLTLVQNPPRLPCGPSVSKLNIFDFDQIFEESMCKWTNKVKVECLLKCLLLPDENGTNR